MKKLLCVILMVLTFTSPAVAGNIKLTTRGIITMKAIKIDKGYGSLLVNIQGECYAVEDTQYWKVKNLKLNQEVMVVFELNEYDRVVKLSIVGRL